MIQNNNTASKINLETGDSVSLILKWILLFIAIACFVVLIWGTYKTYQLVPPLPKQFQTQSGQVMMTDKDIVAGKAGFQRADLMDYGSLYGMGSYLGDVIFALGALLMGYDFMTKLVQRFTEFVLREGKCANLPRS